MITKKRGPQSRLIAELESVFIIDTTLLNIAVKQS